MTTTSATDTFVLSDADVEAFHRDGYIGPISVYDPDDMDSRWSTIRRQLLDRSQAIYPEESQAGVTNIANYDRHLDVDLLSEHVTRPAIVDRVSSVLGPDVLCWRSEFFPKYQGDEGTDWHQAATFANASGRPQILWPAGPDGSRFGGTITVWTAFTDSTRENGCLQILPGTHKVMNYDESLGMKYDPEAINRVDKSGRRRGFFGYDYRQLQIDPDWSVDESDAVALEMSRGQCVIFWSTLLHASYPHTGSVKDYRMGYVARYVPTHVSVYPETDNVNEYGGEIPLDKWGAVLVSGQDDVGINRLASESRRGHRFTPRKVT